jgi:hypothetical protein
MSDDRWIVIPNWDKFQHYKDRAPLWIKVYLELENSDEWAELTLAERGLLVSIWVCIASSNGQIRTSTLQHRVGHRVRIDSLERLNHAGFIQLVASKPEKLRTESASPEKRREREEKSSPISPQVGTVDNSTNSREAGTNPRATGTNQRAVSKSDKEQRHADLLEAARELADTWEIPDSSIFDHELDVLETNHGSSLSFGERDDLWDKAFKLAR